MNKLIIPNRLKKGDTIGIVCPSAGINPKARHRVENATRCLERMGYRVEIGRSLISKGYTSGSIEDRVNDIHNMFSASHIKAVVAATGGNHCSQLLRFIDYGLISRNPKVFSGYSDITILHYAFQAKSNLATFYGPCAATQFGEFPDALEYTKNSFNEATVIRSKERDIIPSDAWTDEFLDWFQKLDLKRPRIKKDNPGYIWLRPGVGTGEALAVCNFSVNRLAGTEFWINPKSKIVFFDIVLESLNYPLLEASLFDLFNTGFFDDINGLIIGRPRGFNQEEIERVYSMILDFSKNKKYPIVANFDLGHTDPINTIRYGQSIRMDSASNKITLYE